MNADLADTLRWLAILKRPALSPLLQLTAGKRHG